MAMTYRLQAEIEATGILKGVAGATQGAPNSIEAAVAGTDFATAAQGAKADSAVQPAALDAALAEAAQFREWFPGGEAKSIADCTGGLKFDWANADETNHTVNLFPFCYTGNPSANNRDKAGRVVIPPYVDHEGARYAVAGIASGSPVDYNTALTSIVAPTTVTGIGDSVFGGCTSLASVTLPAATTIGNYAFGYCTALASVSLPAATSIGSGAINGCTSLASVFLPAVTAIGDEVLYNCTNLATVHLPAVMIIRGNAFKNCTALTSVTVPAATGIEGSAFDGCTSLASVDFGPVARSLVPTLGHSAFPGLSGHACRIIVPDDNYSAWVADPDWAALTSHGYEFVKWSDTQPATREYVDAGLAGKQDAIADLAAIRSGAALGATAVQPGGLPYILISLPIDNGAATLGDRAGNVLGSSSSPISSALTLTLPAAKPGRIRDFLAIIHVAANVSLTFAAPTGETIAYEAEGGTWPDTSAAGKYVFRFTETDAGVFLVQCGKAEAVTPPTIGGAE